MDKINLDIILEAIPESYWEDTVTDVYGNTHNFSTISVMVRTHNFPVFTFTYIDCNSRSIWHGIRISYLFKR